MRQAAGIAPEKIARNGDRGGSFGVTAASPHIAGLVADTAVRYSARSARTGARIARPATTGTAGIAGSPSSSPVSRDEIYAVQHETGKTPEQAEYSRSTQERRGQY